jgi:hypothetical protein
MWRSADSSLQCWAPISAAKLDMRTAQDYTLEEAA